LQQAQAHIHQHLVEECKQGSRKAQYELYKLYSRAMYNASMRILNDSGEAEDVLQEAFLDAFNKINTFRNEANIGSWLKKIVVNKALNQLKKRKIQYTEIDNIESSNDFKDETNTEEQQEKEIQLEQLHNAIQKLPDGFRTVLTLYILEEYSHKQIAEALSISESTSKSQLNRAKAKLKEILAQPAQ
jgi:RNA polymerase sigma factor (sigma-70 family)